MWPKKGSRGSPRDRKSLYFQIWGNSCYLNSSQKCILCPKWKFILALCSCEFESVRMTSLPSSHDFEVLQCIVGCIGSSGVYARGEAVAHCDWLCGQLHQTLAQAAQTTLLWNKKRQEYFTDRYQLINLMRGFDNFPYSLSVPVPTFICIK